jgi:nuclear pore complex protein Nup160
MMDEIAPSYVYKETRINLDSAAQNSTVVVRLPNLSGSNWAGRTAQKRPFSTEIPPAEDENAFKAKHLATSSSIYHRQHHSFPRSFLWRILEDGRVLSIATVDLTKQEKAPDSVLTLRLSFPSPIRPQCVAFAECKEHDVLNVFVLTESNHLFTLNLRPEFFRRRAATDDNAADWCKIYLSSAFSFKHPHRLVALKPTEILITLHDGGLLKLDRLPAEDASAWKETFYNVGGWTHGLKSLIPFQGGNTIKYGKTNIEVTAATSVAVPAIDIEGFTYAFTVSLDHRIRVWNLGSGRITWTGDLVGIDKTPQELGKWVIHPSQSQLIRVLQDVDERTLVITYSPIGAGQFKFWSVSSDGDGAAGLVDMFPGTVFIPPPPTTDVWTLADFTAVLSSSRRDTIQLWLLWKNNTTYRLQSVEVELSGMSVVDAWNSKWTAVALETLLETPTPISLSSDPEDCTEKWLKYILYPGKFTSATIETSLAIYERGQGKSNHAALRTTMNLAERMCTIIGSEAKLSRTANDHVHYDSFKAETDAQWRRFYRLVLELDKQRGEALSLAFDPEHEITWVVAADGLSAIRECSEIERLYHNPETKYSGRFEAVSALVTAGSIFRETFSDSLLQSCKTMLQVELFQDSSLPDSARLRTYYDRCNFDGQIGDDEYSQLIANLGGSFKDVRLDVYETLLEIMTSSDGSDSRLERLPLAIFGRKTVIKGVQETIELHRSICLDQLMLLAFIEGEVDQEQEEMELDTEIVFRRLLEILKRLELLNWLSKTQISIPIIKSERSNSVSVTDKNSLSPTKKREDIKTVTVLEGAISHLLGLVTHSGGSTASLLTELFIDLCDPESDYELQPALIQSFLLVMERADLAMEFSRFCDQHPFSVYIQGRACLATKDLSSAVLYFKKAAYGLGMGTHPPSLFLRLTNMQHMRSLRLWISIALDYLIAQTGFFSIQVFHPITATLFPSLIYQNHIRMLSTLRASHCNSFQAKNHQKPTMLYARISSHVFSRRPS